MPDIPLQQYATKIQDLIRDGCQDEAIAHCRHILLSYPKYIQAYRLLGEACLAQGMYQRACEFFQRALSADPENVAAWAGLGRVYDEQGMLLEAIWPMERAFELTPGNAEVQRELRRLYTRCDGPRCDRAKGARLSLTRGALGRLYARSGLHQKAIDEFRAVLGRNPDLPDIRVALVEALWHEGCHLEAAEVCLEILELLPNCLKAKLILGAIWLHSGREDAAQTRLDVAQALDPENLVAQEMMGAESPLPAKEVLVPILEAKDVAPLAVEAAVEKKASAERIPDWVRALEWIEADILGPPAAGSLDETDLEAGATSLPADEPANTPAELAVEEPGAQQAEEDANWLEALLGKEEMALISKEITSAVEIEVPAEEGPLNMEESPEENSEAQEGTSPAQTE